MQPCRLDALRPTAPRFVVGAMAAIAILLQAGGAAAAALTCRAESVYGCEADRCSASALVSEVVVHIDTVAKSYRRCDRRGCDSYEPVSSRSGNYWNFELPGRTTFLRVDMSEGAGFRFSETLALGLTVIARFGRCAAD